MFARIASVLASDPRICSGIGSLPRARSAIRLLAASGRPAQPRVGARPHTMLQTLASYHLVARPFLRLKDRSAGAEAQTPSSFAYSAWTRRSKQTSQTVRGETLSRRNAWISRAAMAHARGIG